ncbi:MAG: hypothetical protein UT24_C0003G0051 [Candidatus Woesebacteria bacterium GW2011_GWB1_39_12]|uniref:Uncharacterized protein n=1 Tax=Candidatus Woesebacteria bacterium GW2011_GWB1_39_12 TaxID=1618574 RepID=A0A0G0MC85_9BACT|nr:MAG: hypothetical protein UT24_C0003G0051 [Candidatus Woesebacteria bacterium GW2011_GWB1_39_12]
MSEENEARKRVTFKSDLEMWHKFVGFAGWLMMVARGEEHKIYGQCVHYSYDSDAFEEYCNSKDAEKLRKVTHVIKGMKIRAGFKPDEECWQCKFYKLNVPPVKEIAPEKLEKMKQQSRENAQRLRKQFGLKPIREKKESK